MSSPRHSLPLFVLSTILVLVLEQSRAVAQVNVLPAELEGVSVREHLDGQIPLDATFRDHTGRIVQLSQLIRGNKPVVLNLAYYTCPVLCGMVVGGAVRALKQIPWTVGDEFEVITLSIDPRDTPATATRKRNQLLREYGRTPADRGWHVLIGDAANIAKVTRAVGFQSRFDERQGQYAHPAALMLLKPNGRVGRYLYGLEFAANDLRLGLLEVADGKSISSTEHILLFCYRYDPQGSRYVLVAQNVMKIGGALTALALFTFLGVFWLREWRNRNTRSKHEPPVSASAPV